MTGEKEVKRFIKKKVSYSLGLMIKFLITGSLALSLTACGGGGGGGSSSDGGDTPIVNPSRPDGSIPDSKPDTTGYKTYDGNKLRIGQEFKGNKWKITKGTLKGRNLYDTEGIEVSGTNLVSDVDINLQGNELTGINVENSEVVNNGNITINADDSNGIASSDSTIINNGNIEVDGTHYNDELSFPGGFGAGIYSEISKPSFRSINKYVILNTGNIKVSSVTEGYGIYSGVEEMEINLEGEKIEYPNPHIIGADVINQGDITVDVESVKFIDHDAMDGFYYQGEGAGIHAENANVTNDGNITVKGDFTYADGIQLQAYNPSINYLVKNSKDGVIVVDGRDGDKNQNLTGINVYINHDNEKNIKGKVLNEGKIELLPGLENSATGISAFNFEIENSGEIKLVNALGAGIRGYSSKITNTKDGKIIGIDGTIEGIVASGNGCVATNYGIISAKGGKSSHGMVGVAEYQKSVKLINEETGIISIEEDYAMGMSGTHSDNIMGIDEEAGKTEVINKGRIDVKGYDVTGIRVQVKNASAVNRGKITAISTKDGVTNGMWASLGGTIINEKGATITVKGKGACGMLVDTNGSMAINKGTINVEAGAQAGMVTMDDGAIAENRGTINVKAGAEAGMIAMGGGTIINKKGGIINLSSSHNATPENKENIAMKTIVGGSVINNGIINTNRNIFIGRSSTYAVGLNADGSHGKLAANNFIAKSGATLAVDMTPEAKLSTETRKVVIADSKEKSIEEGVNFTTNSILHSVREVATNDGSEVVEVKKTAEIKDFAKNETREVAGLIDNLIANRAAVNPLTVIASRLDSKERLNAAIDRFAGVEYLNLPRQMFNIDNTFKKYDTSVISTLDNYDYNFELIGNFSKDDSKEGINGYENNMTGFNGGAKLAKDLYGTLGYGYSDIDYKDVDSKEKIQTIHAGLYQDNKINEYNIRIGVSGEYNFHEMDRETLGNTANSKFNSYVVGANIETTRRFGNEFYVEPTLGLNLSYGNREAFDENGAKDFNLKVSEEDYTSIIPEVGVKVGRIFNNLEVYANAKYSYELGDVDKDMTIEILNEKAKVKNNKMEEGRFNVSAGMKANFNQIDVNLEVGKEFRDVDRNYVKAGISYTF